MARSHDRGGDCGPGVSRTTAWRDLKYILWGGHITNVVSGEDILAIVTCMYRNGPVVSVTDAEGYELHGAERQNYIQLVKQRERR